MWPITAKASKGFFTEYVNTPALWNLYRGKRHQAIGGAIVGGGVPRSEASPLGDAPNVVAGTHNEKRKMKNCGVFKLPFENI